MRLGKVTEIRIEDIAQKEDHLLRPIDEDHVKAIKKGLEFDRTQAPAIIVQKVSNAFFVRAHNHTFLALRACLEPTINCRIIDGTEEEIIAYCVREQANIKDWKPQEYANAYLKIKRELDKESKNPITLRELANYCKISKSRMGQLIKGVKDERVMNLIKKGASFDNARKSVQQLDKPKVEEKEEDLTKTREAGDYESHPSEVSSVVHPIQTSGKSEDDGEVEQPEISPDGEEGSESTSVSSPSSPPKLDGEPGKADTVTPNGYGTRDPPDQNPLESPPSKPESEIPDYPIRVWIDMCGHTEDTKRAFKNHKCTTSGYQQYLNRVNRDLARAYLPSPKNNNQYWVPLHVLKEMGEHPGCTIYIDQEIERTKEIIRNIENAFENAKSKVGGS